jgi:hypothetical protein
MTTTGKNRIMIFGPKDDGTDVVEVRTAAGEALAISIPGGEARVIQHFQERMPYGLDLHPQRRPYALRCSGTLPPLSASFTMTCRCSQMFISAEPSSTPV